MTDDMPNLRALVQKTPDPDLFRKMIGFAAERLMALEVDAVTGAACGEKDPGRKAHLPACPAQCNISMWQRHGDWIIPEQNRASS